MKVEFAALVVIQCTGEAEGSADTVNIFTNKELTVVPAVVFLPKDALAGLDPNDVEQMMHFIAHHVAKRGEEALRPAVKPTELLPVDNPTDPKKRN